MAQLKSFKSLELPEAAGAANSSEPEPASSASSLASMVGGNLTRSGTSTTLGQASPSTAASQQEGANKPREGRDRRGQQAARASSSSTPANDEEEFALSSLSLPPSSEEDQVVEHKLDVEEGDEAASSDDEAVTRIGIESVRTRAMSALGNVVAAAAERQQQQQDRDFLKQLQVQQEQPAQQLNNVDKSGDPGTPLAQRRVGENRPISRQHASSPNLPLNRLAQSPQQRRVLGQHFGGSSAAYSDSLSQYSFSQRNSGAFEIRWRNIYLMARVSKVPKSLAGSAIYRLFKSTLSRPASKSELGGQAQRAVAHFSSPIVSRNTQQQHSPTISLQSAAEAKGKPPSSPQLGEQQQQQQVLTDGAQSAAPDLFDPTKYEPILNNISGSVLSGQLTAILGPSGVGKTSLLRALTGRNRLEGVGRVHLLGETGKRMQVVTVPQDDVLPEKLSVDEDLHFTSRLKNTVKSFDHQRNIRRIVRLLQLESFTSTRIEKLSGGQRRRLSIARELLSSPDIVILDEPTSGLDANTCRKIIVALRDLAENGGQMMGRPMSIIVTIHQPQIEVYNLFHRVYVMALGGRAIYEGPPSHLLSTLVERSSLSKVCAVDQLNDNPAVVAIEVASGEYGQQVINELAMNQEQQAYEEHCDSPFATPRSAPSKSPLSISPRFELLHRAQLNSSAAMQQRQQNLSENSTGRPTPIITRRPLFQSSDRISAVTSCSYASSYDNDLPAETAPRLKVDKRLRRSVITRGDFLAHTLVLMKRTLLLTTRNMFLMAIRLVGFTLVALNMVQTFAQTLDPDEHICPNYQSEIGDIVEYMQTTRNRLENLEFTLKQLTAAHMFFFHLLLSVTMVTSAIAGLNYPYRVRMFLREHNNGWYSTASFIASQTLAELPIDFIGPAIVVLITYPLCNQPYSEYYWRQVGYLVVLFVSCVLTKSHAEIASTFLIDSVEHSVFVSCVLVAPPTLLSGITIKVISMPHWLQVVSYGSSLRYTFESLLALRFGYGQCPCDPELVHGYPSKISTEAMPPQLDNLARGLFELNSALEVDNLTTAATIDATNTIVEVANKTGGQQAQDENIFHGLVRLLQDSSNLFVPKPEQLGHCDGYRSLLLLDKGIEDRIVLKWLFLMLLMFFILRCLTYFAARAVIKTRR